MPSKTKKEVPFVVHDVENALKARSKLTFKQFSQFNLGSAGIYVAAKGVSPWELHPDSDEFLHVLEGEATIKLLTDEGPTGILVEAGMCFVVPKGIWHRHEVRKRLKELYVTPGSTEHSSASDPRKRGKVSGRAAVASPIDFPELIRAHCLAFPQTHEDYPWGYPAFKVKNKTFAWMSFKEHGINLSVKLPASNLQALALPFVKPSGYGLDRSGWVTVELKKDDTRVPPTVIEDWITESFRAAAPKLLLKEMEKASGQAKKAVKPKPKSKA